MKSNPFGRIALLLCFFMLLLGTTWVVSADGGLTLDWFSVDGGVGHSEGDDFGLSGTIGQPDAAESATGGSYRLDGGFWAGGQPGEVVIYLPMIVTE